jgi:hypothetical protein
MITALPDKLPTLVTITTDVSLRSVLATICYTENTSKRRMS